MQFRQLGNTDLNVSVLSFGSLQFGREDEFGTMSQDVMSAAVASALDAGINLFDTAAGYGRGRSEEALGRALGARRKDVLVATKYLDYGPWSKGAILDSLQASLGRLGTDYVDLFQMHTPNQGYSVEQMEIMLDAFDTALKQGLTRTVGVSNFRQRHLDLMPDEDARGIASNQIPLTLLWRTYDVEGTTAWAKQRGVSYLCYSPLAEGLLTGKYTREARPTYRPISTSKWALDDVYPHTMTVADEVRAVAEESGRTMAQVALRWVIEHEAVASVIVSTLNPKHMTDNLVALDFALAPEHAARLHRASLEYQKYIKSEWTSCWGDK